MCKYCSQVSLYTNTLFKSKLSVKIALQIKNRLMHNLNKAYTLVYICNLINTSDSGGRTK